jgi:hypothetical protein
LSEELKETLPETYRLLKAAKLKFHPRVKKVTLHGSRGPAGGYRDNSDLDLCLVTDIDTRILPVSQCGAILRAVLETTLESATGPVELDLAAIFDNLGCGLRCLSVTNYDALKCPEDHEGCMGVYKIQKGYNGFVPPIIQVKKMFPYLPVWQRKQDKGV